MTKTPVKSEPVPSPVAGDPTLPEDIAARVAAGLDLDEKQRKILDEYEAACARLAAGVS